MTAIMKNVVCALSLMLFAGTAVAATPAPLDRTEMQSVRGEATKFISFGALRKNAIPCSKRGASAANCTNPKPANKFTRGCSAITRCRR